MKDFNKSKTVDTLTEDMKSINIISLSKSQQFYRISKTTTFVICSSESDDTLNSTNSKRNPTSFAGYKSIVEQLSQILNLVFAPSSNSTHYHQQGALVFGPTGSGIYTILAILHLTKSSYNGMFFREIFLVSSSDVMVFCQHDPRHSVRCGKQVRINNWR